MYKSFVIPFFSLVALFGTGCSPSRDNSAEVAQTAPDETTSSDLNMHITADQFSAASMKLGTMEDYAFSSTVRAYGTVDVPPQFMATVSIYYGGYIRNLNLLPGQYVRKGQVLFVLENPDFIQMQQDYLEAQGQLLFLKGDYERQKTLANENIASQKNYLKAESDYKVTLARHEALRKKIGLLGLDPDKVTDSNLQTTVPVVAPIAGYITTIHATQGAYLHPADMAVTITNTEHIHLELDVYEKDMAKVKPDQEIRFRLPDSNGPDYEAEVHLIGKEVDTEKRTINIHGHLKDDKLSSLFVPGMYVEADIVTEKVPCRSLPETAVVKLENDYYVLVQVPTEQEAYHFKRQRIQVGKMENGYAEILNAEDFDPDAVILVNGAFNLIQ